MLLGVLALAVVFPIASTIAPTSAIIDDSTYSLHLETSNSIDLTLNPVTAGALSVAKDTVTGSTNSPSGYKLYISTASNTNDIRLNDDNIIRAGGGSFATPATLSLTDAQNAVWGYAIPGLNNFDNTYTESKPATGTTPAVIPDPSSKFAAMPVAGNEQLILDHTGTATNIETNIYYGVKANLGLSSGNYQGSIRYIAVSDATDIINGEAKIALGSDTPGSNVELTDGYAATTATITTSLNTNLDLSTNTNTTITISSTSSNNTCTNPTISQATGTAVISCNIPAGLAVDTYDVDINITKGIHQFNYEINDAITVKNANVTLTFNANGGTFAGGSTTNVLTYSAPQVTHGTYTKNASYPTGRTDNTDSKTYDNSANNTQTVTIPNASSLTVNVYYETESNYDFVYVYEGASTSGTEKAKLSGTGHKTSPTSYTITGDSVTFKFTSDGSVNNWGYWATVTGEGDEITQNLISGTYNSSPTRSGYTFLGWSTNSQATTPNWTYNPNAIVEENTTIYAVWGKNSTIAYNSNGGTGTIASQEKVYGTSLTLSDGSGYTRSGYTLLGWDTNPSATSPTYKLSGTYSQETDANLYAVWGKNFTITFSSNNTNYGTVSPTTLSIVQGTPLPATGGTSTSITVGGSTVTATAKTNYKLSNWTHSCGTTLTGACTITANFEIAIVTFDQAFAKANKTKVTAKDGKEYYQMQDMTASICSAITAASSTAAADTQIGTLVDNRGDKKTYTVAKLLDGNCWMTENLRLGGSSAITLTSSDSEVSSNFTLPAHKSSWTSTYTAAMIYVSNVIDTVTNQYYGYYYNYFAASAGTVTNSGTVNPTASICPKGWTLPDNYTQTANKSYSNLLHKYGVIANITDTSAYATDGYAKLTSAPLSFALSGYHSPSATTVDNRGSYGNYWSGTSRSPNDAYCLLFGSPNVRPQNGNTKGFGFAIRCVAQ